MMNCWNDVLYTVSSQVSLRVSSYCTPFVYVCIRFVFVQYTKARQISKTKPDNRYTYDVAWLFTSTNCKTSCLGLGRTQSTLNSMRTRIAWEC